MPRQLRAPGRTVCRAGRGPAAELSRGVGAGHQPRAPGRAGRDRVAGAVAGPGGGGGGGLGAWLRTLTPAQIAAGLDDRFSLLVRGPRGAMPRQQTLAASIDWSHDLLEET